MKNGKEHDKEKFKKEFIQRLIRFYVNTIKFTDKLKEEHVSFSMINQLIRCVTSIGANVVKAKSAHSKRDYIKFFEIALKSANEAKYWLIIVKEIHFNFYEKNKVRCF